MPDSHARFLTADIPGIGGAFKVSPDDFRVDELPLYPFSGDGEHTLIHIEKTGISTFEAVRRISQALGANEREVGTAGLKDARATARQWLSVQFADVERARNLAVKAVKILDVTRHKNKLRRGHLAGNVFTCVLRGVAADGEPRAREILARLSAEGVPNYFGNQRFGMHGDTHLLGLAIVQQNPQTLVERLVGPVPDGDWRAALAKLPANRNTERRLVNWLIDHPGDFAGAVKLLPRKMKQFYVSAFQSFLFNRCVDARLPDLRTLRAGDVAFIHGKGASFAVPDPAGEQPRADRFEISPSGPIFGTKTLMASGDVGAAEQSLLDEFGLTLESFKLPGGLSQIGARRPLRFPLTDAHLEWGVPAPESGSETGETRGTNCTVRFALDAGCYATNVLAELVKGDQPPIVPDSDAD